MVQIVRTPSQLGAALRRTRKRLRLSQEALGERMHVRQATISSLESGDPGTRLGTVLDALAALELEFVIRPRTKADPREIEDLFG